MIASMTLEMLFDALALRFNAPKAGDTQLTMNMDFTDTGEQYALRIANSVLRYDKGELDPDADVTMRMTRTALTEIALNAETALPKALESGDLVIEGDAQAMAQIFGLIDDVDLDFNIIEP